MLDYGSSTNLLSHLLAALANLTFAPDILHDTKWKQCEIQTFDHNVNYLNNCNNSICLIFPCVTITAKPKHGICKPNHTKKA
jgi:hypothetical protein